METESDNFLSALSGNADLNNAFTAEDSLFIQNKLWELLGSRVENFTMGDSGSVRVETARELLMSICYVVGLNFESGMPLNTVRARLINEDLNELFKAGLEKVKSKISAGEALLEKAVVSSPAVEIDAYKQTLKEIGSFFKRYHYHHFAHEIPCMIDYPLAHPVSETLLGIDYICDYLRRVIIENDFCGRFNAAAASLLLKSVCPDYKENLLNMYETIAFSAIALTLINGDIHSLDITERGREKLFQLLCACREDEMPLKLEAASTALCADLDISDPDAKEYLRETAAALHARLKAVSQLKQIDVIFPPPYRERTAEKSSATYIDSAPMDDEKLRALIDEITSCRHVTDKIALLKQSAKSLSDFVEILNICFWDDERIALYKTLDKAEIELLLFYVSRKQKRHPEWKSETGWENCLFDFTKKHRTRQARPDDAGETGV